MKVSGRRKPRRPIEDPSKLTPRRPRRVRDDPAIEDRLAWSRKGLAVVLRRRKNAAAADEEHQAAIGIWEKLVTQFPARYEYQVELAWCHQQRGDLLGDRKDRKGLDQEYGRAIAACEGPIAARPGVSKYKGNLSQIYHNYGMALQDLLGDNKGATQQFKKAIVLREAIVAANGKDVRSRDGLAWSRNNLGDALRALKDPVEAVRELRKAIVIREAIVAERPDDATHRAALAKHYRNLGAAFYDQDDDAKASAAYGRAIALSRTWSPAIPSTWNTGRTSPRVGVVSPTSSGMSPAPRNPAEAAEQFRQAIAIDRGLVRERPDLPEYQTELDGTLGDLAELLRDARDENRAGRPADAFLKLGSLAFETSLYGLAVDFFEVAFAARGPLSRNRSRPITG